MAECPTRNKYVTVCYGQEFIDRMNDVVNLIGTSLERYYDRVDFRFLDRTRPADQVSWPFTQELLKLFDELSEPDARLAALLLREKIPSLLRAAIDDIGDAELAVAWFQYRESGKQELRRQEEVDRVQGNDFRKASAED